MADTTPEKAFDHADYAGFWRRFLAATIDLIVYVPFYYAITLPFDYNHHWWGELAFALFFTITYSWFFSSKLQASPGMYILKFHICDTRGKPITFGRGVFWIITGTIGCAICLAGALYLQTRFDIYAVNDLLRSCQEQNVDMADCAREIESIINIPWASFIQLCFAALGLMFFLFFIWALSIALPKDKTGFHNLICRTRFVKGRA